MHTRFLLTFLFSLLPSAFCLGESRPNVLWITWEDISRDLGCYGDDYSISPNVDQLAREGVLYTRAWSNAGMCAPARATLITGMYPSSTGAMNMRSEVTLPDNIRGYPEYLRKAGYFCSNHVKMDYNWVAPESTWDTVNSDWENKGWNLRKPGQPFFTIINITDTHSSQLYYRGEERYQERLKRLKPGQLHDPAKVAVPPYYPDTPEVRQDLARYYDNITYADLLVGDILKKLEDDGLADDTIVFYYSDHGRGMPRSKGWLFQTSLRVPFIIRFPEKYKHLAPSAPGTTTDRMVSFVDFAPTLLSLCGVEIPDHMQGKAFLGEQETEPRQLQFAYRDRMDERIDLIRAVWDGKYKYIRNFRSNLPWFHHQTRNYPHKQGSYQVLHQYYAEGKLNEDQAQFMAMSRPREQLFDTDADPYELHNLAGMPEYQNILKRKREQLNRWQHDILDLGFMPESQWWTRFGVEGDKLDRHSLVREKPELYPLSEIMHVADLIDRGPRVLNEQIHFLSSEDPVIRYWALQGILAQKHNGRPAMPKLREMLEDEVSINRIEAAQALCALG
ncbi:MAG: sulfatase-like hydrolase/transferase, partial [Verrucomicrobiae bacterium]|nr:sulfatase-like hydrolase/transferase [Verrucomicrobiae bacterium]